MSPRKHDVPDELLSSLLANYQKPEDLVGENGLLKQLTKMLVEKALNAEMTEHLGHQKHEPVANASSMPRILSSISVFAMGAQYGDKALLSTSNHTSYS